MVTKQMINHCLLDASFDQILLLYNHLLTVVDF